jgi:hypothetical protein
MATVFRFQSTVERVTLMSAKSEVENELRARITEKNAIIIVGAGVSKAASNHPYADWQGLLRAGFEYVTDNCPALREESRESLSLRVNQRENLDEWLTAAYEIQSTLRRNGQFENWLEESVGRIRPVNKELIDAIGALDVPIFTTNYDGILSEHLNRSVITWEEPDEILRVLRKKDNAHRKNIVHLHGYYKRPSSVVFGVDSYTRLIKASLTPDIERAIALSNDMIFIGVGDGLDDPNFGGLTEWLRSIGGGGVGMRHYRLVAEADQVSIHPLLKNVTYGARHEELVSFLQRIRPKRTGGAVETPEIEAQFNVAAVQFDFTPNERFKDGTWHSSEPVLTPFPSARQYRMSSLSETLGERLISLRRRFRKEYEAEISRKIEQLVKFSVDSNIDLLVFPQSVMPASSIDSILRVSGQICVVIGLGHIGDRAVESLENSLGKSLRGVLKRGQDYILVTGPQGATLLAGRGQQLEPVRATDSILIKARTREGWSYRLRVEAESKRSKSQALVVSADGDVQDGRLAVRATATHSRTEGSAAILVDPTAQVSVDEFPLQAAEESEAIVGLACSWKGQHVDVAHIHSAIIHPSRRSRLQPVLSAGLDAVRLGQSPEYSSVFEELASDTGSRGVDVVKEVLRWASKNDDLPSEAEGRLWNHCILPGELLTRAERAYMQVHDTLRALKGLQAQDEVSRFIRKYEEAAVQLSSKLRPERLHVADQQRLGQSEAQQHLDADLYGELIFAATLGTYDSARAIAALDKSLRLLQLVASQPDILLQYRIVTNEIENNEDLSATFFVICTAQPATEKNRVAELRRTIGNQLSVTFHGAYSLAYTDGSRDRPWSDLLRDVDWATSTGVIGPAEEGRIPEVCDSALLVDFLRSHETPTAITFSCRASKSQPREVAPDRTTRTSSGIDGLHEKLSHLELANASDSSMLDVSVTVHSKDGTLGNEIANVIGINACGIPGMKILDEIEVGVNPWLLKPTFTLSPVLALRFFHPPVGEIYHTSTDFGGRIPRIPAHISDFPPGISFGTAEVRRSTGDRVVQARLSEEDRFRHLYVIGKPGMGKTTLLKDLIRQDLEMNHGVTVIDPHGELVEAVATMVPPRRLDEVVLVDLDSGATDHSRKLALPIINPLDLPERDRLAADRAIQEILRFIQQRIYHQWSGPRFEELARLVLKTMLDAGYPVPPAITEVPSILRSEQIRALVSSRVIDPLLREGWTFLRKQEISHEFQETLAWATAKFDEVANDSALRVVMGGEKTTIDVESIVNRGGILLVRLPEFSVGERAAGFIGSTIIARLRQATFVDLSAAQTRPPHFVYMDEFHRFAIEGFDRMVAEARKFRVGFTLAHQNVDQLRQFDPHSGATTHQLASSIPGNVGTVIAFPIAAGDVDYVSRLVGCPPGLFDDLGPYRAISAFSIKGQLNQPFLLSPQDVKTGPTDAAMAELRHRMRDSGRWREIEEVEDEIRQRIRRLETDND